MLRNWEQFCTGIYEQPRLIEKGNENQLQFNEENIYNKMDTCMFGKLSDKMITAQLATGARFTEILNPNSKMESLGWKNYSKESIREAALKLLEKCTKVMDNTGFNKIV